MFTLISCPAYGQTQPLEGKEGSIGIPFTLGNREPVQVTIHSAHYAVDRFEFNPAERFPTKEHKYLILKVSVQNAHQSQISWTRGAGRLRFTLVHDNGSRNILSRVIYVNKTLDELGFAIKPAQRVDGWVFFKMPYDQPAEKLIVQYLSEVPIARIDLSDHTLALPEWCRGREEYIAPAVVSGKSGIWYPKPWLDVALLGFKTSRNDPTGRSQALGNYVTANIAIRGVGREGISDQVSHFFVANLDFGDGVLSSPVIVTSSPLLLMDKPEGNRNLPPKGEVFLRRIVFKAPDNMTPQAMLITHRATGRGIRFAFESAEASIADLAEVERTWLFETATSDVRFISTSNDKQPLTQDEVDRFGRYLAVLNRRYSDLKGQDRQDFNVLLDRFLRFGTHSQPKHYHIFVAKPLTPAELKRMSSILEYLGKNGNLNGPQVVDLEALHRRWSEHGLAGTDEETLKQLGELVGALSQVVGKVAPEAFSKYLEYLEEGITQMIGGLAKGEENSYEQFRLQMGGLQGKKAFERYEQLAGGFPAGWVSRFYARYQLEMLRKTAGK